MAETLKPNSAAESGDNIENTNKVIMEVYQAEKDLDAKLAELDKQIDAITAKKKPLQSKRRKERARIKTLDMDLKYYDQVKGLIDLNKSTEDKAKAQMKVFYDVLTAGDQMDFITIFDQAPIAGSAGTVAESSATDDEPTAAEAKKINDAGYAASKAGKPASDNPYDEDTPRSHCWFAGWERHQKDAVTAMGKGGKGKTPNGAEAAA